MNTNTTAATPATITVQIKHRYTCDVIYTANITADTPASLQMRAALEQAAKARADLAGANLARADLAGTYLAGANLVDADLAGANLARADLAGANLAGAYLVDAYLAGAYLAGAYLAGAYLVDADLAGANLVDADLAGANLADANLAGAYLVDADLAGANLAGAYLVDADLVDAYLAGAYLAGAYLAGAKNVPDGTSATSPAEPYKRDARAIAERQANRAQRYRLMHPDVPVVPALDARILQAIEAGGELDMGAWHTCETTHCRAGWAIALAGAPGAALEKQHGPATAGQMIYSASVGRVPHFYATNARAMDDLRRQAALQAGEAAA